MENYKVGQNGINNFKSAICSNLWLPSGNAVRFEPGEVKSVELVAFDGNQIIYGFHNKIDGKL